MTHIITSLCLRDSGCVDVCPVECIVPGKPVSEWPWYYIDPDTCIDCGACIPECPYEAIFTEDEVPSAYEARGGEYISMVGLTGHYEGTNHHGEPVVLDTVRELEAGEVVDLTPDIDPNYKYFTDGPGYKALDM
jgi:ferredoxin